MSVGTPQPGSSTASPLNVTYRMDRVQPYLHGRWLDFGCADGGYVAEMLQRGAESVDGVDVMEERIAEALTRDLPGATFQAFDGSRLPFEDARFDGVFMNEVLEHVADEGVALSEIARVLRPGGRLLLMSPNRWFPVEGHRLVVRGKEINSPSPLVPWLPDRMTRPVRTARNYWPRQMRRLVQRAGLHVDGVEFVWPVLEYYPWLPARGIAFYQRHFRSWDHLPGIRRFGVSTMIVATKP
ncbi:hypothetical protein GCM10011519_05930 [Marmoricola endophyticus]|uniref:Methyltransferase type 11 domain-containing protein n=1 Tax=Marmoricola endophyticus TaxID=2040280 RepID=A0A917BE04_9ACTN|nr:class I SAM-dependent methyltransferase [Marmoricola endophyticus]GGF35315.1 hypothetical protein GCM10011519_05930 [Marmoricola endophyticus]